MRLVDGGDSDVGGVGMGAELKASRECGYGGSVEREKRDVVAWEWRQS